MSNLTPAEVLTIEPAHLRVKILVEDLVTGRRPLLTTNSKVIKNEKTGYLTKVLNMAPAKLSVPYGGQDLCAKSTPGCRGSCLIFSGHNKMPYQKWIQIAKAVFWTQHPTWFTGQLFTECERHIKNAKRRGLEPAVRPNGLSDQIGLALALAREFPELQVYDYTKRILRAALALEQPNYHLTLSRSETNEEQWRNAMLVYPLNGAVVFDTDNIADFPERYCGFPVIEGDSTDARFLEQFDKPRVIGLTLKGSKKAKAHARKTGFAVPV